jgi:ubiquinone/menaquinone biosynthesis C-methylase UbiE
MTVTSDHAGVEELRRFAAVGLCPACRGELGGATVEEGVLVCSHCHQGITSQRRVVVTLPVGEASAAGPLRGWAAGIAADMDGKAATYVAKYHRRTRVSAGFLVRRELALAMAGPSPGKVLEAGCGPGVVSPLLGEQGIDTYGLDLSVGQLQTAATSDPHTLYVQGDLSTLPLKDATFDTVILIGVLEYVDDAPRVMRELARVLSKNGRLVVSVPNAASPVRVWTQYLYLPLTRLTKRLVGRPVASYSRRLYTLASLERLLGGAGLRVEQTRFFDVVLAGPPLDRFLADRPPRLAERLETRLRGPLRSFLSIQILVSAAKDAGVSGVDAREAGADTRTSGGRSEAPA